MYCRRLLLLRGLGQVVLTMLSNIIDRKSLPEALNITKNGILANTIYNSATHKNILFLFSFCSHQRKITITTFRRRDIFHFPFSFPMDLIPFNWFHAICFSPGTYIAVSSTLFALVTDQRIMRDNFLDKIPLQSLDFIKSFFFFNSFIIFFIILSITFFTIIVYLLVDDLHNIDIK